VDDVTSQGPDDVSKFEITLLQWARSPWTLLLTRLSIIVLTFVASATAGGVAWLIWWGTGQSNAKVDALAPRVSAIERSVGEVSDAQASRAVDSESFQQEVRRAISDLKASGRATNSLLSDLGERIADTQTDVGVLKRLMQADKSDVAAAVPWELRPSQP
jgi:hypothetical protein